MFGLVYSILNQLRLCCSLEIQWRTVIRLVDLKIMSWHLIEDRRDVWLESASCEKQHNANCFLFVNPT